MSGSQDFFLIQNLLFGIFKSLELKSIIKRVKMAWACKEELVQETWSAAIRERKWSIMGTVLPGSKWCGVQGDRAQFSSADSGEVFGVPASVCSSSSCLFTADWLTEGSEHVLNFPEPWFSHLWNVPTANLPPKEGAKLLKQVRKFSQT